MSVSSNGSPNNCSANFANDAFPLSLPKVALVKSLFDYYYIEIIDIHPQIR